MYLYCIYLIPILFLIISILIWYEYGRDDEVTETVEFYPPEGLNSLDVGYLYKGEATRKDVMSLLVYLANKGYIKITKLDKKSALSQSSNFKITKLKEYDGNNDNERLILDGLFNQKRASTFKSKAMENLDQGISVQDEHETLNEVTETDLYGTFFITATKILFNINNKENKNKVFEKITSGKFGIILLMIITTFIIITIPPVFNYYFTELYFYSFHEYWILIFILPQVLFCDFLMPGLGIYVFSRFLFGKSPAVYANGKMVRSSLANKILGLIWGLVFAGTPWISDLLPMSEGNPVYMIGYGIGILCVLGMFMCLEYLPKRTPYGNEMLGKIKGFKNFLETAEKEELEKMVSQNPTYYYDILPYAYVLDVSNKWIEEFEEIALQAPLHFDSAEIFDLLSMGSNL